MQSFAISSVTVSTWFFYAACAAIVVWVIASLIAMIRGRK